MFCMCLHESSVRKDVTKPSQQVWVGLNFKWILLWFTFNFRFRHKLLSCIQTPFLEMRNMIRPPPSPIHAEGESLSEWFCPLTGSESPSECSSFSLPFAELPMSYADDTSEASSACILPERIQQDRLSPVNDSSVRRKLFYCVLVSVVSKCFDLQVLEVIQVFHLIFAGSIRVTQQHQKKNLARKRR